MGQTRHDAEQTDNGKFSNSPSHVPPPLLAGLTIQDSLGHGFNGTAPYLGRRKTPSHAWSSCAVPIFDRCTVHTAEPVIISHKMEDAL